MDIDYLLEVAWRDSGASIKSPVWQTPTAVHSKCGESAFYTATRTIDDILNKFWWHHTTENHWIIWDLGATYTVSKVRIYQWTSYFFGAALGLYVYVSDDPADWGASVWDGVLNAADWQESGTFNKSGRYVKIVSKSDYENQLLCEMDAEVLVLDPTQKSVIGPLFDPNDNLTDEIMSVEAMRGRDFDSAVGRWVPGQLNALLRNDDGKYSPNNAGSPLAGYLKTGRPVVLSGGLRESSLAAKFVAADARHLGHADHAYLSVGDIYWDMVVWIKTPDPATNGAILSKRISPNDPEYYLRITGNRFVFGVRNAADAATITVTANTFGDISANTWYCVHCYHDPIANAIGISVNAGAHDTAAIAGGILDGVGEFIVGGIYLGGILRLTGDVGPLAIWKPTGTNLTAAQLTWLYNGGYGRDFSELGVSETDGQYLIYDVAGNAILDPWWQMNEASGTRVESKALAVSLAESGGVVSSEAGLDTKIYRGLWAGIIDAITPSVPVAGGFHSVTLKCLGSLSALAVAKALNLPVAAHLTGTWIENILLAFCADQYLADWDAGQTITGLFYPANDAAVLELLRQVEDCEPGLLYELLTAQPSSQRYFIANAFLLGYTDRWHRLTSTRSLISQATFSDAPGGGLSITGLEQLDPLNGIYNSIQVTVMPPDTAGGLAVLWEGGAVQLAPGEKGFFTAIYPTDATGGAAAAYVNPWTTPVVGTDVNTSGHKWDAYLEVVVADVVKSANQMRFSVQNIHTYKAIWVSAPVQARGIPWAKATLALYSAQDATSIAAYGLRAYPLPPKWLPDYVGAVNFCNYIISRYCLPHNRLRMTFVASRDAASMHQALTGLIGDRITLDADGLSGLGIHEDFYIESINHAIDMGKTRHIMTYELVSCSGEGAYAVLDNPAIGWGGSPLEYDPAHPTYPTSRAEY